MAKKVIPEGSITFELNAENSFDYIRQVYESLIEPLAQSSTSSSSPTSQCINVNHIRLRLSKLVFFNSVKDALNVSIQNKEKLSVDHLFNILLTSLKNSGTASF